MALACPALERLALQGCRALGEAPLAALAAGCPSLKELDLQYCPVGGWGMADGGLGCARVQAGRQMVRAACLCSSSLASHPAPTCSK